MIYRVVISHKQSEYLRYFDTKTPTVFVFDSITDSDILAVGERPYIVVSTTGNRAANRNAGLGYWLNHGVSSQDIIEFFDGDRFPKCYVNPEKEMLDYNADIILYRCEQDTRLNYTKPGYMLCMNGPGNPFFSCGFALRKSTIDTIMQFNHGQLFCEDFVGWGGEDQYLGTITAHLNLRCVLSSGTVLNGSVGGDMEEHSDYIQAMNLYLKLVIKNGMRATFIRNTVPVQETQLSPNCK